MGERLVHRGPDGGDVWLSDDNRIGFAHRRLSIIDLSARAMQPMRDGELVLTYNGEIYNHAELRRELETLGVGPWNTLHSDTEVLLKAYRAWGIDCLQHLRGMFAFALWDGRQRVLWLVRDRLGIKPLYYVRLNGCLSFASEIKALLVDRKLPRRIDTESLYHYFSFISTHAPRTLFEGIRKLPAGGLLRCSADGRCRFDRYWDPLDGQRGVFGKEAARAQFREHLTTSVRRRTVSDVPLGVFLSGGLDSSTIAALLAREQQAAIKAFSVGFPAETGDLGYARRMAAHVGARHHIHHLDAEEFQSAMRRMTWHNDEPVTDPACIPNFFIARLARQQGVIVCQVGEGADELLGGYGNWPEALHQQRRFSPLVPRTCWRAARALLFRRDGGNFRLMKRLERAGRGIPLFWGNIDLGADQCKRALFSPELRRAFEGRSSWEVIEPIWRDFRERAERPTDLLWMCYVELRTRLPELLLMRVDRMTMASGLEARVPYLDQDLVEWLMQVPDEWKIAAGRSKILLRDSVGDLLPAAVITRPKQAFCCARMINWVRGEAGENARAAVARFCRSTELLDETTALNCLGANSLLGWALYGLALWHEIFIEGDPAAPAF